MTEIDDGLEIPARVGKDRIKPEKRAALVAILDAARAAGGWEAFRIGAVQKGLPQDLGRATLFRWLGEVRGVDLELENAAIIAALKQGRAGQALGEADAARVRRGPIDKGLQRARSRQPEKVLEVAREVKAKASAAPAALSVAHEMPSMEETASVMVPIPVMDKIRVCINAAHEVMEKSRNADGSVRNAKLMLMASEQLRRSLDTAVKLQEAISDGLQIERFHQTIMDEIRKIDPDVARSIVAKLNEINANWSGRNEA
jgi:hypothetical protein